MYALGAYRGQGTARQSLDEIPYAILCLRNTPVITRIGWFTRSNPHKTHSEVKKRGFRQNGPWNDTSPLPKNIDLL